MGADFVLYHVTIPHDQKPDWDAGRKHIQNLTDEDIKNELSGAYTKDTLLSKLDDLKKACDGNRRDATVLRFGHLDVLLTGGMSWGDSPSDLSDIINDLEAVGVIGEIGFDMDNKDYKAILQKVLKTKAIAPLLIGVDKTLDKMIDKGARKCQK